MTSSFQDRLSGGAGLGLKAPVRVATTANVTLSALQTIDGVVLVDGDRVLVRSQSTGAENGIYLARTGAWQRAPDWDGTGDVVTGTLVFVPLGSTLNLKLYRVSTTGTIVVGTTSVAFSVAATFS